MHLPAEPEVNLESFLLLVIQSVFQNRSPRFVTFLFKESILGRKKKLFKLVFRDQNGADLKKKIAAGCLPGTSFTAGSDSGVSRDD